MSDVLPYVVIGLTGGAAYALLALGLVLVHQSSRLLTFAHGEIGAFGALLAAWLVQDLDAPWLVAVPLAVTAGAALSVAVRLLLLTRVTAGRLPALVGTIAALLVLTVAETRLFATDESASRPFPPALSTDGFRLFDTVVSPTQVLIVGSVAAVCLALWALLARTDIGLAIRASADDRDAAKAVGLRPARVETVTWALAGALAGLAGVFLGWVGQQVGPGFLLYALGGSLTAAIIGGLGSLPGAVVGGLLVGLAEALTRRWLGSTPGSPQLVVFALLFLALLVRPQGLFSRTRGGLDTDATESLVSLRPLVVVPAARRPIAVWARTNGLALAAGAAAFAVLVSRLSPLDAFRLSLVPIYVILALSLSSLVATTGQVSLAHVGLLGVGAFMTAVADTSWGMPFLAAWAVGTVSAGAVALLLGLAAMRVRGLHLAVLTLSFALVLELFVFPRDEFSKGGAGLRLDRPDLLGIDLASERTFLVLAVVVMALVWLVDRRLLASPLGNAWIALRENDVAAQSRGISGPALRTAAFAVSGLTAGLAGGLFAYRIGHLVSALFPLFLSFTVILWVVLGGIGSRVGVASVTTVFALNTIYGGGGESGDWAVLAGAAIVVATIGLRPDGLSGLARDLAGRRWRAVRSGSRGAAVASVATPEGPT